MKSKIEQHYVEILVWLTLIATLSIITFFTIPLVIQFRQIGSTEKSSLMENILEGTLALGALSLTVLGYSFSQIRSGRSTIEKTPYRRLSCIMYFIIPFSMVDALISSIFILTKTPYSFEVSLILLYIIVVGLIIAVSLWVRKELK